MVEQNWELVQAGPRLLAETLRRKMTKQKHLHCSPDEQFTINHYDNALPTIVSTKFLGVHFDKFMTWDHYINHVHKLTEIFTH